MMLDELAAIKKAVGFLGSKLAFGPAEIDALDEKYRQQVKARHAHIIPPHFDIQRKVPAEKLYVSPDFTRASKGKQDEPQQFGLGQFLSSLYRAVLLGNPGSGKTTFAQKLCHDLAARYSQALYGGRRVTPIPVVLREYGAEKKAQSCSILQFIEAQANGRYQVVVPAQVFEYLLLHGRAVVVFDGLDELLDTTYRQEITDDIESFCNLYPSTPVLVTSRVVGYDQAPLDQTKFDVFRLSDFNEEQVRAYALKWFAIDPDLTTAQQQAQVGSFLEESSSVADLRSNPLMLSLMCNIYRGENYIPRNRPDVFEKCSLMLFERWDKSRGIHVELPFEVHIRPTMMHLARWIYGDEGLQGGATERALVARAADYLCSRRFEDRDEAESAARAFIEFCRGRAWVFTDVGTTRDGERLYQFTHRTFLEYFAACDIVRRNPTPDSLAREILTKVVRGEWDVVAQLSFQVLNKNVEGAGDELLDLVLAKAEMRPGRQRMSLLAFSGRCLEFIVPRPCTVRRVVTACLESWLTWGLRTPKQRERSSKDPVAVFALLLMAARENRRVIADCLEVSLVKRISKASQREGALALEVADGLVHAFITTRGRMGAPGELRRFWSSVSQKILDVCQADMRRLAKKHEASALRAVYMHVISLDEFVQWHGVRGLFEDCPHVMFPGVSTTSLLNGLTSSLFRPYYWEKGSQHIDRAIEFVKDLAAILESLPPPWLEATQAIRRMGLGDLEGDEKPVVRDGMEKLSKDPDVLFAAFASRAVIWESVPTGQRGRMTAQLKACRDPVVTCLRPLWLARGSRTRPKTVDALVKKTRFSAVQKAIARQWVLGEVDFTRTAGDDSHAASRARGSRRRQKQSLSRRKPAGRG